MPQGAREAIFKKREAEMLVKRIGTPGEVAEAVRPSSLTRREWETDGVIQYMFAMKYSFLTGQIIYVDGGALLV